MQDIRIIQTSVSVLGLNNSDILLSLMNSIILKYVAVQPANTAGLQSTVLVRNNPNHRRTYKPGDNILFQAIYSPQSCVSLQNVYPSGQIVFVVSKT
jgi:hypothetical protein